MVRMNHWNRYLFLTMKMMASRGDPHLKMSSIPLYMAWYSPHSGSFIFVRSEGWGKHTEKSTLN
jgi:hypothetical protein